MSKNKSPTDFRKQANQSVGAIGISEAKSFCVRWHYSNIFPPHCLINLCYRDEKGLAGVAMWGWGVRPKHTIQKLFPSLDTPDYFELNRLCLRDDCPRNSESWFLAQCAKWIKANCPEKKVLLTWADGMRGKPGYIYQASNWLYGGFITTEIYLTPEGEPVHPRMIITRHGSRCQEKTDELGLRKIWGRQFIYALPLCDSKQRAKFLAASPQPWSTVYPKQNDLVWGRSGEVVEPPLIGKSGKFRNPAQGLFDEIAA